jgi:hypothetical protein
VLLRPAAEWWMMTRGASSNADLCDDGADGIRFHCGRVEKAAAAEATDMHAKFLQKSEDATTTATKIDLLILMLGIVHC